MTKIALTLSGRTSRRNQAARELYVASIARPGVDVIMVLPTTEIPDEFDAVYMTGGEDLDPAWYREESNGSELPDKDRDKLEFDLLERALERDVPVLGICRGFQVLNVRFGGSLEQHVVGHRAKELGIPDTDPTAPHAVQHHISVDRGSLLARELGATTLTVNSSHHQVVTPTRFAPRDLRATVIHEGIVEALESTKHRWVVGVQWHPERTNQVDEAAGRIFDAFVRAAERVPAR